MQAPPSETVERWLWEYVHSTSLAHKLAPPPVPSRWETAPPERRIARPGRPSELQVREKSRKFPGPGALLQPLGRARTDALDGCKLVKARRAGSGDAL